jgi:hypothetical protein
MTRGAPHKSLQGFGQRKITLGNETGILIVLKVAKNYMCHSLLVVIFFTVKQRLSCSHWLLLQGGEFRESC